MMGKDVERILSGIDAVKDAASNSSGSLALAMSYRAGFDEHNRESEVHASSSGFMSPVINAIAGIESDCGRMSELKSGLYTDSKAFNNSYGSPWTELSNLQNAVSVAKSFASSHDPLKFVGEKAALAELLNKVVLAAIDARWALMHFHDYIQRGYDNKYNNNIPSITFPGGDGKDTIGNIVHHYDENVHIPEPSIDPY